MLVKYKIMFENMIQKMRMLCILCFLYVNKRIQKSYVVVCVVVQLRKNMDCEFDECVYIGEMY